MWEGRPPPRPHRCEEDRPHAMLTTLILVLPGLLLVGAMPIWLHSRRWGLYPSGTIAAFLLVASLLWLLENL
jgi:hypothetical protein